MANTQPTATLTYDLWGGSEPSVCVDVSPGKTKPQIPTLIDPTLKASFPLAPTPILVEVPPQHHPQFDHLNE